MCKMIPPCIQAIAAERVEHEGIVRIWAVPNTNRDRGSSGCHDEPGVLEFAVFSCSLQFFPFPYLTAQPAV